MKAQSKAIVQFLSSKTEFTDEMAVRLFPLVANDTVPYPFATYRIVTTQGESKDADKGTITLSLWYKDNKYTECITFSDTVEQLIKEKFDWISSDVEFIERDQSFVANINFEIT